MNNIFAAFPILLLFAMCAFAETKTVGVIAQSSDDAYWVCIITTDGADKPMTSSVRQRIDPIGGTWNDIARLQTRIIDAAGMGNQLAILLDDGEWRILGPGEIGAIGLPLPEPYKPVRLAGDGASLLAIAEPVAAAGTQPTTLPVSLPAIWRWSQDKWTRVADLPANVDPKKAVLGTANGRVLIAYEDATQVVTDRYSDNQWQRIGAVASAGVFKVFDNSSTPLVGVRNNAGAWLVQTPAGKVLREFEPKSVSDVVMVGPTLRLVYADDKGIGQIAYDDYGAGSVIGPVMIAQSPGAPQSAQFGMQVVVMGLLLISMLLTFRQKPAVPAEFLEAAKIQIAPNLRRFAAGMIDLAPMIAIVFYATPTDVQGPLGLEAVQQRMLLPISIGTGIYMLHTGISEAIWGRSVGKFLFGLRVAAYDGAKPGTGQIFLRNLMRVLDVCLLAPLFLVLLTPLRQRIGDLSARTIVILDEAPEAR